MRSSLSRFASLAIVAAVVTSCASAGGVPAGGSEPGPGQSSQTPAEQWPINTYEHVDLWLHGFAMIQDDTTLVPYFKRGYKAEMLDIKRRANVTTQLDANITTLRNRLVQNPALVNAQFLPMYFGSLDEMVQALDLFERADGNPRAASSQEAASLIALLAGYFPQGADRDWARLYVQSIRDENTRFYRSYWDQQQRERASTLTAVREQWQNMYRPRFERFLNNTSQAGGEIVLSLPLDGEGRTLSAGKRQNSTAVTFPLRPADAPEAIYVIAHELVGQIVQTAVNDNVTPTDARNGLAERYIAAGTVRAGAILLQQIAPGLSDGYARYYLRSANRTASSATLANTFVLPDKIRDAIARQIEIVLGGI